jgi:surfactin synthase thioesterase subunit
LSLLVGDADPRVSVAEAQEWRQHTASAFRFRVFPGGHFYLAEPTTDLAAAVVDDLEWFTSGSVPAPSTISVGSPDGFSDRH